MWVGLGALLVVVSLFPLSSLFSSEAADSLPFESLLSVFIAELAIRKLAIDEDREGAVEAVIAATVLRVDQGE